MGRDRLRDAQAAQLAAGLAAYALGVEPAEILSPGRGAAEAASARQLAMYLTHVGFAMSLARVANAFGRDRSTVAHACQRIEDWRDDETVDLLVESLESALREAPEPMSSPSLGRPV
jgi:chromosomal replication initiation ATPase DnaA